MVGRLAGSPRRHRCRPGARHAQQGRVRALGVEQGRPALRPALLERPGRRLRRRLNPAARRLVAREAGLPRAGHRDGRDDGRARRAAGVAGPPGHCAAVPGRPPTPVGRGRLGTQPGPPRALALVGARRRGRRRRAPVGVDHRPCLAGRGRRRHRCGVRAPGRGGLRRRGGRRWPAARPRRRPRGGSGGVRRDHAAGTRHHRGPGPRLDLAPAGAVRRRGVPRDACGRAAARARARRRGSLAAGAPCRAGPGHCRPCRARAGRRGAGGGAVGSSGVGAADAAAGRDRRTPLARPARVAGPAPAQLGHHRVARRAGARADHRRRRAGLLAGGRAARGRTAVAGGRRAARRVR